MIKDKQDTRTNPPSLPKKKINPKESSSLAPCSGKNPCNNPILLGEEESSSLVPCSGENPCNNPILLGEGSLSFTVDEQSGRKYYMTGAKGLKIEWEANPKYWSWPSSTDSRFSTVAQLREVYFFDVKGNIETRILDPETTYAAYLVFKFAQFRNGFDGRIMNSIIYLEGSQQNIDITSCELNIPRQSRIRGDQWMEIELGEFSNQQQYEGTLVCHLFDHNTDVRKSGIIIEGIEFRPRI